MPAADCIVDEHCGACHARARGGDVEEDRSEPDGDQPQQLARDLYGEQRRLKHQGKDDIVDRLDREGRSNPQRTSCRQRIHQLGGLGKPADEDRQKDQDQ